jgi:hypothetical protein
MKIKAHVMAISIIIVGVSAAYGFSGQCPEVTKGWDGKTALEGWTIDPKYKDKLKLEEEYKFLNAWIYDPGVKLAVCHYTYGTSGKNQLSLVRAGIDSSNSHFAEEPEPKPKYSDKNKGWHCKRMPASACAFLEGPLPSPEVQMKK